MRGRKEQCCALVVISAGSWTLLMTGSLGASARIRLSAIREQKHVNKASSVVVLHSDHLKKVVT